MLLYPDVDGVSADVRPGQGAHHAGMSPHVPDLHNTGAILWGGLLSAERLECRKHSKSLLLHFYVFVHLYRF